MYSISCDGNVVYMPVQEEEYAAYSLRWERELNKAGSLEFTLPVCNGMYNGIKKMKSTIDLREDGRVVWRGRPLSADRGLYRNKKYLCEGALAFFLDSVVRPYTYRGNVRGLFEKLVNMHNSQVEDNRKFVIGDCDVTGNVSVSNVYYKNTINEITDQLVKPFGGYIKFRYTDTDTIIDYKKDPGNISTQRIRFGENLLDLDEFIDATDVATVIIPLGAKQTKDTNASDSGAEDMDTDDGDTNRVKITNAFASGWGGGALSGIFGGIWGSNLLAGGSGIKDYVEHEEGVRMFGKVWRTVIWDDVTSRTQLIALAKKQLEASVSEAITFTIGAVDLHHVDVDVEKIELGDQVVVESRPHEINMMRVCCRIVSNLERLAENEYTFGDGQADLSVRSVNIEQQTLENVNNLYKQAFNLKKAIMKTNQYVSSFSDFKEIIDENMKKLAEKFNLAFPVIDELDSVVELPAGADSEVGDVYEVNGTKYIYTSQGWTEWVDLDYEEIDVDDYEDEDEAVSGQD